MDILVSSNLERFLYFMSEGDGKAVEEYMQALKADGKYSVPQDVVARMKDVLDSGAVDEAGTLQVIGDIFKETGYLLDTHTAIAVSVAEAKADGRVMVVDSTANPYKFVGAVWQAINGEASDESDLALLDTLSAKSGMPVHRALANLTEKPKHERVVIGAEEINDAVMNVIRNR